MEGQKFEFWQVTMLGSVSMEAKYTVLYLLFAQKCHVSLTQTWDDPVFHLSIPDWILDVKMEGSKFSRSPQKTWDIMVPTLLGFPAHLNIPMKRLVSLKQLNLKKKTYENSYSTTLNYPGILNISRPIFRHFFPAFPKRWD